MVSKQTQVKKKSWEGRETPSALNLDVKTADQSILRSVVPRFLFNDSLFLYVQRNHNAY